MKIVFELSDRDLAHFRKEMRRAREAVRSADDGEIIAAARDVLDSVRAADTLPGFVLDRLNGLETLIAMIDDTDWRAPAADRRRTLQALVYFADPEDMIPDTVPGLGFLDDAIMVELVLGELKHDIEAYTDFVAFRESLKAGSTRGWRIAGRLDRRRDQLRARAHRRRAGDTRLGRFVFWRR